MVAARQQRLTRRRAQRRRVEAVEPQRRPPRAARTSASGTARRTRSRTRTRHRRAGPPARSARPPAAAAARSADTTCRGPSRRTSSARRGLVRDRQDAAGRVERSSMSLGRESGRIARLREDLGPVVLHARRPSSRRSPRPARAPARRRSCTRTRERRRRAGRAARRDGLPACRVKSSIAMSPLEFPGREERAAAGPAPDADRLLRPVVEVVGLRLAGDRAAVLVGDVVEGRRAADHALARDAVHLLADRAHEVAPAARGDVVREPVGLQVARAARPSASTRTRGTHGRACGCCGRAQERVGLRLELVDADPAVRGEHAAERGSGRSCRRPRSARRAPAPSQA